ncbi:MAG TPA: DedA family protein [Gammaproteobacteria bacterium]|nr:DedA family protein [Gammaproteobacteria bacterium]
MLSHYLIAAKPYLEHYGYLAVFVGVMLEDFGVPAPGETLVIAGAALAAQGAMSLLVFPAAWAGAVIGDNIGYAIGHFGGRRLVLRFGPKVGIRASHVARTERFFRRYGGVLVAVARFFEVLRQLNGIVAGISAMPWWSFLAWNALGAALWVGTWGAAAWFLGHHLHAVIAIVEHWAPDFIGAAAVIALAALAWVLWRRHRDNP